MKYNIQYRTGDSRTRFAYVSYLIKVLDNSRILLNTEGEVIQYQRIER